MTPQDRPKVIGLVLAIIAVMAFAVWRLRSMTPAAPAAELNNAVASNATPPVSPPKVDGAMTSNPATTGSQSEQLSSKPLPPQSTSSDVNPFHKVLPNQNATTPKGSVALAQSAVKPATAPPKPLAGNLPLAVKVEPEANAMASYRVAGVVGSSRNAMVVLQGEHDVLYQHVGDTLKNGMLIARADHGTITLEGQQGRKQLQVGDLVEPSPAGLDTSK